jgi:hypothetical protein
MLGITRETQSVEMERENESTLSTPATGGNSDPYLMMGCDLPARSPFSSVAM